MRQTDKEKTDVSHGEKMPTNFTVVPVDDGRKSSQEDSDDNNVLKEEDEETVGEMFPQGIFQTESKQPGWI